MYKRENCDKVALIRKLYNLGVQGHPQKRQSQFLKSLACVSRYIYIYRLGENIMVVDFFDLLDAKN